MTSTNLPAGQVLVSSEISFLSHSPSTHFLVHQKKKYLLSKSIVNTSWTTACLKNEKLWINKTDTGLNCLLTDSGTPKGVSCVYSSKKLPWQNILPWQYSCGHLMVLHNLTTERPNHFTNHSGFTHGLLSNGTHYVGTL